MNKDLLKFKKREIHEIGLDLYFYSFRTLCLFQYEVLYQITEGAWNYSRYPSGHGDVWKTANLHITQGKSNVRCIVEFGCNILKNDYNLKKILNIGTSYRRLESIGRLINCDIDELSIISLLNAGFHENYSKWDGDFSYNELVSELYENPETRELSELITPELLDKYSESTYSFEDIKDDLGMIQNTMRTTMSL